jgi:hypothetical protein
MAAKLGNGGCFLSAGLNVRLPALEFRVVDLVDEARRFGRRPLLAGNHERWSLLGLGLSGDKVLATAVTRAASGGPLTGHRRLSEIQRNVLRVSRRRCERTVEIQKVDAVRLYGPDVVWKDVGQRLLDDTCQVRTGRHEEDGRWPSFE